MPDMGIGTAILGSSLLGAAGSIFGSSSAADAQKQAAAQATAAQLQMFNTAKGLAQPFIDFGTSNLSPLSKLLTPGPDATATLEQTPGYNFALTQGEKGITNQATMTGLSGNALRAGSTFASGLASETYNSVVGNLLKAAGIGQQAASGVGGQATTVGGQIGANITGAGNAKAAADIATGNAVGGVGNNLVSASLLNALSGGKLFGASGLWGSGSPATAAA